MITCPTTTIRAPAERVWHLLTDAGEVARWTDMAVRSAPDRPLRAGDRLVLGAGRRGPLRVSWDVLEAVPPLRLAIDVRLPFGMLNHEVVVIVPVPPSRDECRVTFN